jgi:hypothetical protein
MIWPVRIAAALLAVAGLHSTASGPPAPVPAAPADPARIRYVQPAALPVPNGSRPVTSLLKVKGPLRFGSYVWHEDGAEAGATWVRVDLKRQTMSVFRGGDEIGTAVVLFGTDGKPTPKGSFQVLERDADHHSSLYDAPMPYMLRLTNDGVAIHASNVRRGSATHGCLGVPMEFARRLYAAMRRGDRVYVV